VLPPPCRHGSASRPPRPGGLASVLASPPARRVTFRQAGDRQRRGLGEADRIGQRRNPLGIEAARNAGMRCVAIETTLGKEYLKSADHVLPNVAALLSLPILSGDSKR